MSSISDKPKRALLSADAVASFGMPETVFLDGEDPSVYQSMLDQVRTAVAPSDFIEQAWVRDIVDLLWESIRAKRLKAAFVNARTYVGLTVLLEPLLGRQIAADTAERWFRNDPAAIKQVDKLLARAGRTIEDARILTIYKHIYMIDAFDRKIAGAETRRSNILKEIDRRRAAFSLALRSALTPMEEAEFTVVDQSRRADPAS